MTVSVSEWLARGEWAKRSGELGAIRRSAPIAMEYRAGVPDELWELWQSLPPHRNRLRALEGDGHWLQFAALDWTAAARPPSEKQSAIAIARIARVFEAIASRLAPIDVGWFAAPRVYYDLEGEPRVGFVQPAERVPCDAAALVETVRRELAWSAAAATIPTDDQPRTLWNIAETGLGHLYAGDAETATAYLKRATNADPARRFEPVYAAIRGRVVQKTRTFTARRGVQRSAIEALTAAGDHRGAISLAVSARYVDPETAAWLAEVTPSLYYRADKLEEAIVASEKALVARPGDAELHMIHTQALLRMRESKRALASAEAWLAACPDDGRAHLARGNALVKLGRPDEARAAFAKAKTETLGALYARRAVDQRAAVDRAVAGVAFAMPELVVPEHLAPLRELVLANRIDDALAYLAEQASDAEAQLLRAELLVHARRANEALAIVETRTDDRARGVCGYALLALERAAEAIAHFEAIGDREGLARARERLAQK